MPESITTAMGISKVAIIGSRVTGLVTLEILLEAGFDAMAFESGNTIGGLWKSPPMGRLCLSWRQR
jgi:cation diffusion facilitator CzcD-associated flavoprotein CzcO